MKHNYSKLLGLLREKDISQSELASLIGTTPTTLNLILNGKGDFKLSEVKQVCNVLQISSEHIGKFFNQ